MNRIRFLNAKNNIIFYVSLSEVNPLIIEVLENLNRRYPNSKLASTVAVYLPDNLINSEFEKIGIFKEVTVAMGWIGEKRVLSIRSLIKELS